MRVRRILLAAAVLVVLGLAAGYALVVLPGGDAPPPPRLSGGGGAGAAAGAGVLRPGAGSFAGYRVREKYLGVGVRTAVGRTTALAGTVTVTGGRVTAADLTANLLLLQSDRAQRDAALHDRAIETNRFPGARFTLAGPVRIAAAPQRANGTLLLHGRRAAIAVTVRGRATRGGVELVGSAPIAFRRFAITPPSVAGLVTVEDHGLLEFRLELHR
jgi:polyisoprenoid-binding protein YceI